MTALIDGDHITFIACHNKRLKDNKGKPILLNGEFVYENKSLDDMKDVVDAYMKHMIKRTKADNFVLALTRGKCFRYDVYPEYKANRKYGERPEFFYEISDYVKTKYRGIVIDGYEADDIIASYKKEYNGDSVILSTDKDLLHCIVGAHYDPKRNVPVITSSYDAEHNFWKSMIVGDVTDNIFGLKGKGPAYWQNMITDSNNVGTFYQKVMKAYVDYYKDVNIAIDEFYKNYKCLHLYDKIDMEFLPKPLDCEEYGL